MQLVALLVLGGQFLLKTLEGNRFIYDCEVFNHKETLLFL